MVADPEGNALLSPNEFKVTAFLLALLGAACTSPATADIYGHGAREAQTRGEPNRLAMIVPAKGVQIYECRARRIKPGDTNGRSWLPKPIFFDASGHRIGRQHADIGNRTMAEDRGR